MIPTESARMIWLSLCFMMRNRTMKPPRKMFYLFLLPQEMHCALRNVCLPNCPKKSHQAR